MSQKSSVPQVAKSVSQALMPDSRLKYPDLRRKVANLAIKHSAGTILIENVGPGMALLQDLQRDLPRGMARPIGQKPEGSKADRMVAQTAKIEAGYL